MKKRKKTSNVQLGEETARVREDTGTPYGTKEQTRYDLEERLLKHAVRVIRLVDALPSTRAGRHVADQLLRCGTSPLANHGELQCAESRKDFIHKLGICLKEIREARRWLRLIHRVPLIPPSKIEPLLGETEALTKIFAASIRTAEKNAR
ncbi:MAG: four helix bundle protein [Chthoniobacterales bacterium]